MKSNIILSVHSCILDVHGEKKIPQHLENQSKDQIINANECHLAYFKRQRPTELQIETLNSVLIYHDNAITRSYYTGFIINKTGLICTRYKHSNKYSLYTNSLVLHT